ncbi:MAG: biotin-dependent carboxyltransferase family protein [Marinobacter sp.]
MSGLRVINPGARATVQDSGRRGYRRHGLSAGGALDIHSFSWANKLLDNPANSACVELLLGGFEAEAETDMVVAVAGAATRVRVNGQPQNGWQTVQLSQGDRFAVDPTRSGRITYIATPGGFDTATWFGSRSVVVREQIEGIEAIQKGDILSPVHATSRYQPRRVPERFRGHYSDRMTLRLVPAAQYSQFNQDDLLRLTTSTYRVSNHSDRMGFRLEGPALERVPTGIISEGIAVGSVQVPGDGKPIVLLNDCQTIGGYPKPGTLGALDAGQLAQRLPGQELEICFANVADIQNERVVFHRFFSESCWHSDGYSLSWR